MSIRGSELTILGLEAGGGVDNLAFSPQVGQVNDVPYPLEGSKLVQVWSRQEA